MDELSKVKSDLEGALKDVLQAMKSNQGTISCDAIINIPSLETLANVSASRMLNDLWSLSKSIMCLEKKRICVLYRQKNVFQSRKGPKTLFPAPQIQ